MGDSLPAGTQYLQLRTL
uniref:Uncharacterized protein n=1 Tax=Anguilla anguilla TaxID=7936 RepID=A0A0E9SR53_ANGAN